MAKARGALEALYDGLVQARDDIRQKVVEEPWFGRAVTDGVGPAQEAASEKVDSLADFYGKNVPPSAELEPAREQEREIERD